MSEVTVHHGDSREVLKGIADASIDACVCDPPYALVSIGKRFGKPGSAPAKSGGASGVYARASAGFMGQQWDTGETAFDPEFWGEVFRVLKPGAHLVAFSGTRTYHRLACAIEDAGFEIRDMIAYVYGSGFPKSHDIAALRDGGGKIVRPRVPAPEFADGAFAEGWGTALKPALEPIVFARKPLDGTVAANVLQHGTGALNIDGCRVAVDETVDARQLRVLNRGLRQGDSGWGMNGAASDTPACVKPEGRWPANVVHDGSDEVLNAFPETQSGVMRAGTRRAAQDVPGSVVYGVYGGNATGSDAPGDSGSAARFFYTAKAGAEDRLGSRHPTVKPVDLMAWLCRLVTPPGGLILDPFAGTGTTGIAALREGFDCILIEREAQYVADIQRRLAWVRGEGRLTAQEMSRAESKTVEDLPLFGGEAA